MWKQFSKIFTPWCKHNFKKIFKYCRVIMVESISKMLWANFFLKNELFIKVLVLILHNKMVWLKKKNKHLLEVAQALLFTNQVPKYLWGEVVLTTTYLINRMLNKVVLNFETPFDVFHKFFL